MLLLRVFVIALSVYTAPICRGEPTPPQLSSGRQCPSADGKLIVFYDPPKLEIRDAHSSAVLGTAEAPPVYAFRWTRDSKTLVIVQHIAHGSKAFFVHFDGRTWKTIRPTLPGEGKYRAVSVVDVTPHESSVGITYETYGDSYLVSFTFAPSTQKISDLRRRKISLEEWQNMLLFPLN